MKNVVFKLVLAFASLSLLGACGSGGSGGGGGGDATVATFTTGDFTAATTTANSVGSAGGTIAVNTGDLNGLQIVVPAGAADEDISFTVSSADIDEYGDLPTGAAPSSKMIRIQASGSDSWNEYRLFNKAVKVTLPYTAPADLQEDTMRFYFFNEDGTLEPVGLEGIDTDNNTITFWTRTFADIANDDAGDPSFSANAEADKALGEYKAASLTYSAYVAIGLTASTVSDWTNNATSIDTGFTAGSNGWYIPNYGSYYKQSRGGNCFGMVGFAKWYYKKGKSPALRSNYRDSEPTETWLDDSTAIQLASRVHNGMSDIWDEFVSGEVNEQEQSSAKVAYSLAGALYVTGTPAMLYIQQVTEDAAGNKNYSGAHAISTYRVDFDTSGNMTFYLYDPNHPNDDSRRATYTEGTGFSNYLSGTTAGNSSFSYNYFKHIGYRVGLTDSVISNLKESADDGFSDDSVFPTITITSITGKNNSEDVMANTGTTDEGQDKYITSDTSVILSGTVLGGLAQDACCVVNNLRVLTPQANYSTPVNNSAGSGDGTFSIELPVLSGENMIAMLAGKSSSYSWWAAFDQIIIDSTASASDLTVTLSWAKDDSDIDLYVQEPTLGGTTGDTVYWQNKRGSGGTNPYLDVDNTSGYGPENYIGEDGMSTLAGGTSNPDGLYGDYKVKVHYYADHDDDTENVQPVPWTVTWRYLAYCPAPCDDPESDGFWVSGSESGTLTNASSGNCCNINNTGADWSSEWTVAYDEPDPDDWVVPDSHTIMLP